MAEDVLILKGWGNVDVQIGGPGNAWQYLSACAYMDGPTVPHGDTELRWCQDPRKSGGFKVSTKIKTAPDQASGNLMSKLSKLMFLNHLKDMDCSFGIRARYARCGERFDPSNYDPLMINYCPVDLTEHSYDDLVIADPANEDEILLTMPWTATSEYAIKKLTPGRIGTTDLGDQAINDIEFCDAARCAGYCGERSDGCAKIYAVSAADIAPYAAPNLIVGTKTLATSVWAWAAYPILGFNGAAVGVECAGSRLLAASNADSAVAYNDDGGDQDSWHVVVLGYAPAANPNSLFAYSARIIWVGAETGRVYKSVDGGETYTAVHAGTLTTETINAVWAYDANLVYAVGDNGVILKTEDGGETWTDITETSTTSADLLTVVVPPDRADEVYVGTNTGQIFRSVDEGDTFAEYSFTGNGVGTVDSLRFCGPCAGDVLFILHNDAGPRGRILRDLSGGAGGADVEVAAGYTSVIGAGVDLNALACCSENEAVAAGALSGGYPVIVRVS